MPTDTETALVGLVATRRRQVAAAVDALDATKALLEVVQLQAASHDMSTVERLLATAPSEETRGAWQALIDRSLQPIPPLTEGTPR